MSASKGTQALWTAINVISSCSLALLDSNLTAQCCPHPSSHTQHRASPHHVLYLQAPAQFPQQHQLPFNLGSAAPHQSYPAQYPALQNLGLPGQGLQTLGNSVAAHTSLGSAAYGEHHQRPLGNQQSFPQNFTSQDLATQLHLQRLQAQQRSYAQPQQQNVDLNKLFAPRAFGHAPAPATPAAPVSFVCVAGACGNMLDQQHQTGTGLALANSALCALYTNFTLGKYVSSRNCTTFLL